MALAKDQYSDLKWIDEDPKKTPRVTDSLEDAEDRTFTNTIIKKSRENILVPVGLLATTACLTLGLFNMTKDDSKKQQFYMRGRVAAQGFTLAAMTLGVAWQAYKIKTKSTTTSDSQD